MSDDGSKGNAPIREYGLPLLLGAAAGLAWEVFKRVRAADAPAPASPGAEPLRAEASPEQAPPASGPGHDAATARAIREQQRIFEKGAWGWK